MRTPLTHNEKSLNHCHQPDENRISAYVPPIRLPRKYDIQFNFIEIARYCVAAKALGATRAYRWRQHDTVCDNYKTEIHHYTVRITQLSSRLYEIRGYLERHTHN